MASAVRTWPVRGVPDSPTAWLIAAARNHALDVTRRSARFAEKAADVAESMTPANDAGSSEAIFEHELSDDELRLIFLCCHPAVTPAARVALTLNVVAGLDAEAIARVFFLRPQAVYQRLHRAKKRIAQADVVLKIPGPEHIRERRHAALDVIYLMFNEGYSARSGEPVFRRDLIDEALRLAGLMAAHTVARSPAVHALHALLLLQSSRMDARLDGDGALVRLPDQNRGRWDSQRIEQGVAELARASAGAAMSEYHLLAGIAACHAAAASYGATDWRRIAGLYGRLAALKRSFVVEVSRAFAVAQVEGAAAGLAILDAIGDARGKDYYLLGATRGELYAGLGDNAAACEHLRAAAEAAPSRAERASLLRRADSFADAPAAGAGRTSHGL
jgi:RNA polymerase sigma-70 factor (ECF subfamily)